MYLVRLVYLISTDLIFLLMMHRESNYETFRYMFLAVYCLRLVL
jgi:hypothetical protein